MITDVFAKPYSEAYKANRKFFMQALRAHGFNKSRLNGVLSEEWSELTRAFDSREARQGVDPQKNFQWAAANVIRSVLFDKRLPHGDKGTKIRTKLSESLLRTIHAHVHVLLRTGRVF